MTKKGPLHSLAPLGLGFCKGSAQSLSSHLVAHYPQVPMASSTWGPGVRVLGWGWREQPFMDVTRVGGGPAPRSLA